MKKIPSAVYKIKPNSLPGIISEKCTVMEVIPLPLHMEGYYRKNGTYVKPHKRYYKASLFNRLYPNPSEKLLVGNEESGFKIVDFPKDAILIKINI